MTGFVHTVVVFAEAHAGLIYVLAFIATCLESIAFIGLAIPGSAIIVALGALVPSGAVGFWWLCAWSILGALAGDGLSYWIGRRYGDQLKGGWPFTRYRNLLFQGERFFAAHGGKSVFLSRFVAPVRGVIPLIAGMTHMPFGRFIAINLASAMGWAPSHVLPGVLIGAGLTLTGAVATRPLIFLVALTALLWLAAKIVVVSVRHGSPWLVRARGRVDGWARQNDGWFSRQLLALIDPTRGEVHVLALLGLVLVGAAWISLGVLEDAISGDSLVLADTAVYNLLQGLRSPVADKAMIAITVLGGVSVAGSLAVAVLLWLTWQRAWHAIAYWIAAISGASLIDLVIKMALHRPRPIPAYVGWDAFSLPSGHAAASVAIYGFLAVLLARGAKPAHQASIGAAAVLIVALMGFSRLYLGIQWFSDAIGDIAFGTTWVALLAIAYIRHRLPNLRVTSLAAIVIAASTGIGGLQIVHKLPADLRQYAARYSEPTIAADFWWRDGWRNLPSRRIDLGGGREEPLVLQWAGSSDGLRDSLTARGWRLPIPWSVQSAVNWLAPDADLLARPVLPRLHDGRSAALTLIHAEENGNPAATRWVLRVWRADIQLIAPNGQARMLWVAAITQQHFNKAFAVFDLGFETKEVAIPWPLVEPALQTAGFAIKTDIRDGIQVMSAYDPAP